MQPEAGRRDRHDGHFQQLGQAGDQRLVVLVSQLPGRGRKQEKGQDKDAGGQISQQFRRQCRPLRRLKSQQHDQRILVKIVVEGAEKLRAEKRCETAGFQECELTTHR